MHGLHETTCNFCAATVTLSATASTFDGSTTRYHCPDCQRWTRGPPPL